MKGVVTLQMLSELEATIIAAFKPLFSSTNIAFEQIGITQLYIPRFPLETLEILCKDMIEVLKKDPPLLHLHGDFIIIGDIHGNLRDFLRILATIDIEKYQLLFLGDFVDRGSFSMEVLMLIFALKVIHPNQIFLIRGNHEFPDINKAYGFREQVLGTYNKELYEKFNEVFTYLPLAAIVNGDSFCVHGGISPLLKNFDSLSKITLPSVDFSETEEHELVTDIIWSDPVNTDEGYIQSPRGYGYMFGEKAINEFISDTKMKRVIRGHQCIAEGVRCSFGDRLYTVFSSSNYATDLPNNSGFLFLPTYGKPIIHTFPALPVIECERVHYRNFTYGQVSIPVPQRTLRSSLLLSGKGHKTPGAIKRRLPMMHISPAMSSTMVNTHPYKLSMTPTKVSSFAFEEESNPTHESQRSEMNVSKRQFKSFPSRTSTRSVDSIV